MAFRLFSDDTRWEQARLDLRSTAASVAAEALKAREEVAKRQGRVSLRISKPEPE